VSSILYISLAQAQPWFLLCLSRSDHEKLRSMIPTDYCVGSPLIRQDSWRSVMHLDIKPDNIFLLKKINHPREVPKLVLGDFGLAALSNQTARRVGPSYWQGPEWPRASRKTDIWALGAIIHWLCHGRGPIDPRPEYASTPKDEWAEDPDVKNPQPLPEEYSEPLNRVMMACFRRDPRRRIDSSDLLPLVEEGREIFHYQYS